MSWPHDRFVPWDGALSHIWYLSQDGSGHAWCMAGLFRRSNAYWSKLDVTEYPECLECAGTAYESPQMEPHKWKISR